MLRLLLNIIVLVLIARMLRPLFQKGRRYYRNMFGSTPGGPRVTRQKERRGADLSQYDIEDGDYEEIHPDGR